MIHEAIAIHRYGPRIGERVGSLTFLRVSDRRSDGNRIMGEFLCECGRITTLPAGRVLTGKFRRHCGCQTDHGSHRTHGMRNSPEYSSWMAMKGRCLDPNNKDYPRWGGRGVTVCAEWAESFEAFFAHVGPRPAGTTLDRIHNNRGYEPGNVRWATHQQQQANRRDTWIVEIDGVQYDSAEAAAIAHGVSTTTIKRWCEVFFDPRRAHQINHGWTPARHGCRMWRKYAS